MIADHYSILGVSPSAEDVVIRAAYRALMRHYHPDTNPDPEAQRKAREITAAFAVLRDPASRAEYDARKQGPLLWAEEELPVPPRRPPAMRGWALASAALALGLVVTVTLWPQPEPTAGRKSTSPPVHQLAAAHHEPLVELEPESARLAKLRGDSSPVSEPPLSPPVAQAEPTVPPLNPVVSVPPPTRETIRIAAATPTRRPVREAPPTPAQAAITPPERTAATALSEASAGCRPGGSLGVSVACKNERLATLDRMAAGFFSQSMAHADAAKKELLMSSHSRSAATRSACRSDSCVSDAYLRQMREISAIMEGRSVPSE